MFIDNAFVTVMNAQEVANAIQHFYNSESEDHFKLEVTTPRGTETHWVRPLLDRAPYALEDVSQIVMCETKAGRSLSLLIPRLKREYQPATVVFARNTASAG